MNAFEKKREWEREKEKEKGKEREREREKEKERERERGGERAHGVESWRACGMIQRTKKKC